MGIYFRSPVGSHEIEWVTAEIGVGYWSGYGILRYSSGRWQSLLKAWVLYKTGRVAYNQEIKYYLW